MADAGLYQSLLATPNYQVRRQDAAKELIIAKQMRDDAVAKMQEQMKSMGAISEYLNKSQKIENELLPSDAERVKAKDMELRKAFIDDPLLQQDPTMFMMSGGNAKLDKYERELSGSEELRNGIENKKNFTLGTDAVMKRHVVTPVEVEFDGGTKQTMPWVDALDLHQQGVIKKLPFKSSIPLVDFDPLAFARIEAPDSEKKYGGFVSFEALAKKLQAENPYLTDEEARSQADVYKNPDVPGATVISWGRRLPHTSGYGSYYAKQQDQDLYALDRYNYIYSGVPNPKNNFSGYNESLIGGIIMNQPYKGGFISKFKIHPKGQPFRSYPDGKIRKASNDVVLLEYTVKTSRGYSKKQDEIVLNEDNDYGLHFFNDLANVNNESTPQYVTDESLKAIKDADPAFQKGGSTKKNDDPLGIFE